MGFRFLELVDLLLVQVFRNNDMEETNLVNSKFLCRFQGTFFNVIIIQYDVLPHHQRNIDAQILYHF